jgi:predicted metal-dependent hydrolase
MQIEIHRSPKRAKTVSARFVDGVIQVKAPANIAESELQPIIANLVKRLEQRQAKKALDDRALDQMAHKLNKQYFNGSLKWAQIRWSTDQQKRYGSCSPSQRTIRISSRLATMPRFVVEYVVMHELAHLLEANHSDRFWRLVYQYPKTERARGYLMAVGIEEIDEASP